MIRLQAEERSFIVDVRRRRGGRAELPADEVGGFGDDKRCSHERACLCDRPSTRLVIRIGVVGGRQAHRSGAKRVTEYAETELRATGARPRRVVLTGLDSLTASERRIAEFAGRGLTNREIAQTLFVTARTVEGHLTSGDTEPPRFTLA